MNTGESGAYRIGFGTGPIVFCGEQEIRNLIVEILFERFGGMNPLISVNQEIIFQTSKVEQIENL